MRARRLRPGLAFAGLALAVLALPGAALAQNAVHDCSLTLTTAGTAYQMLAADAGRLKIEWQNLSASGQVGYSRTNTSPAIGSAGTVTAQPLAYYFTPAGLYDSGALYLVGSVSGQVVTCTYWR